MKKLIALTIFLGCFAAASAAQTIKSPVKKVAPTPVQTAVVSELSDAEWKNLTDALRKEDWTNAAPLAAGHLKKLKTDNEKKQLAQLRYFYLYSLAGKILAASVARIPVDKSAMRKELDDAVSSFIGKEIVQPPRPFLPECKAVLNYICAVRDSDKTLRVTATNQEGTMIHSFDYVLFDEKISWGEFVNKEIFLGGKLKRAEFNDDLSKLWVMRLIYENGFVKIVPTADK